MVYQAKENYFLFNSGGERLYVSKKGHSYDIGDILSIEGEKKEFSFVTIESSFDFGEYLNRKGVYKELKPKLIKVDFHNPIRNNERRNKLLNQFDENTRSVVSKILFSDGEDNELTYELKDLHLARFLAVSGLFITAFYKGFKRVLSRFMKDKWAELIAILILLPYVIFTFPRFSVLKVMLFLIIKWINSYPLKKKFSYLSLLGMLGIFCLICNKHLAKQDSFILGFSIPLISYLTKNIYSSKKIRHWFIRYLIVYMFFLPFEALYYNKIVILSLPLQILLSPIFILLAVLSLLCFFYVPIYPLVNFLGGLIKGLVSFISPLSFGLLMPEFNSIITLVYYSIYLVWLYYLSKSFVPLYKTAFMVLLSMLMINALPIKNSVTNEVNFINVGQGDCTLIRNRNKVTLIDTGGLTYMDVAKDSLIPYFRKNHIYKIDTVFITHYDHDHYGGLSSLQKEYKIKHIYDYHSAYPIKIGDITFTNHNYYASSNDENDKSLVISFSIMKKDFVIMGDAPSYVEKAIIEDKREIKCDILKVGHHGSNTSTSEEWLKYLTPSEAIVSCGNNNKYGHPNKEVVSLLNKYKIKIHRTDLEGTIVYKQLFNN